MQCYYYHTVWACFAQVFPGARTVDEEESVSVKSSNMATIRTPPAHRGRCHYRRPTLREASSAHLIVFQPLRLDRSIMGWIPWGGSATQFFFLAAPLAA